MFLSTVIGKNYFLTKKYYNNMKKTYQRAEYDEGFDEIFLINEKSELTLIPNELNKAIKP